MSKASRAAQKMADDAATRTVNITQADIDHGIASDCESCPLALAAQRAFPENSLLAGVGEVFVYERVEGSLIEAATQCTLEVESEWMHDACDFVHAVDAGQPVEPRTVKLVRTYQRGE